MTNFNIHIVSDAVCPWCYVGKIRLDKAIAEHRSQNPSDNFATTWAPFYLNADAPKTGIDKTAYYRAKFGDARTNMIFQRLAHLGKLEGIDFKFGGKTGNTRDAHRLIQLGKEHGEAMQTRVVEELFKAYFENEQDITSHEVLKSAGTKAGLDEKEATDWLESDKGGAKVDKEVKNAQTKFIQGVPHFTVNGQYEVSGAEDPETFLNIFQKVKNGDKANGVANGETC